MASSNNDALKNKDWKISESLSPFIGEMCHNGTYIVCNVCCDWDDEGIGFAKVFLQSNYWISYFKDHIKSAQHKTNCSNKARFEEANWWRSQNGHQPQKRLKQTKLNFPSQNSSPQKIGERVAGNVCPIAASGNTKNANEKDDTITRVYELTKSSNVFFCNGMLAKKI